jgi:hypothetical protein
VGRKLQPSVITVGDGQHAEAQPRQAVAQRITEYRILRDNEDLGRVIVGQLANGTPFCCMNVTSDVRLIRRSCDPGMRKPSRNPLSTHFVTVRGATLQSFATSPVVNSAFIGVPFSAGGASAMRVRNMPRFVPT